MGGVKSSKTYCFRSNLGHPGFPKGPGCGYNSRGRDLKLPELRSGSFGVELGPAWGPEGPDQIPNRPRPDLGQLQNGLHMICSQYRPLGGQGAPNSIKNLRSRKSGAVTSGRHIAEIPRMHTQDTCPTSIDHLCKRLCNEERVCHETDFGAADPSERIGGRLWDGAYTTIPNDVGAEL